MILDISPYNRSEANFSILLSWGAVGARHLRLFKSIHILPFLSDWAETWQVDTVCPPNQSETNFLISSWGRCWGAPLEIFKSIHGLQYWFAWVETRYDNTRHNLLNRYEQDVFRCRVKAQKYQNFFANIICTCFLPSPSQKSRSSRSEWWLQRPIDTIFEWCYCIIIRIAEKRNWNGWSRYDIGRGTGREGGFIVRGWNTVDLRQANG